METGLGMLRSTSPRKPNLPLGKSDLTMVTTAVLLAPRDTPPTIKKIKMLQKAKMIDPFKGKI